MSNHLMLDDSAATSRARLCTEFGHDFAYSAVYYGIILSHFWSHNSNIGRFKNVTGEICIIVAIITAIFADNPTTRPWLQPPVTLKQQPYLDISWLPQNIYK